MVKIIKEGCIVECSHCRTTFSFEPIEVRVQHERVPAGYEPGEEAYDTPLFFVNCPKCHRPNQVDSALGPDGKRAALERAKAERLGDYDI